MSALDLRWTITGTVKFGKHRATIIAAAQVADDADTRAAPRAALRRRVERLKRIRRFPSACKPGWRRETTRHGCRPVHHADHRQGLGREPGRRRPAVRDGVRLRADRVSAHRGTLLVCRVLRVRAAARGDDPPLRPGGFAVLRHPQGDHAVPADPGGRDLRGGGRLRDQPGAGRPVRHRPADLRRARAGDRGAVHPHHAARLRPVLLPLPHGPAPLPVPVGAP